MSLIYALIKDAVEWVKWVELEPKLVDLGWFDGSEMRKELREAGTEVRWSKPEAVERRLGEGYEVVFELDSLKHTRRRIVLRDGLTLIGSKREPR